MKHKDSKNEILKYLEEHGVEDKDLSKNITVDKKNYSHKNQNSKTLDLHGKREDEAVEILKNSVYRCCKDGTRELLVIHGKGLHSSPLDGPVLRNAVHQLLQYELKSSIKYYETAPRNRGGSGATIIRF